MRILGVNCSPRKGKTTMRALEACLSAAASALSGIETEILELGGLKIEGCRACDACKKGPVCRVEDDLAAIIARLGAPEVKAVVVGTPVYLGTMTSQCKAFLDRSVVLRRNGFLLSNKIGGVLAVGGVRNGGQELTIQAVQAAMLCHDMTIVGDGMRTAHFGGALWSGVPGGMDADTEGLTTAKNLGKRVAMLMGMLWD